MNAHSLLAHLFHPGSNEAQAAAELLEAEQLIRLTPTLTADELPPEFEEILEVQVLGYRERLTSLHGGGRQRGGARSGLDACSQGRMSKAYNSPQFEVCFGPTVGSGAAARFHSPELQSRLLIW